MSEQRAEAKKEKENDGSGGQVLATLLVAGGAAVIGFLANDLWKTWRNSRQQEQPHTSQTSSPSEQAKMNARKKNRTASSNNIPEAVKCIVCLTNEREITLEPCGHVSLCMDCGEKVTLCPICRKHIANRKMIFMS